MEILIPIVTSIFTIFSIIFLCFFGYPFLFRYVIDTKVDSVVQSGTNGLNGLNGIHGQNSPDTKHGTHGMPGLSSPSGTDGNHGRNGQNGTFGFKGDEGEHGDDGDEGEDGVPGNTIISVKEDLLDEDHPNVYYIAGLKIDDHAEKMQTTALDFTNSQKNQTLDLINNMLIKDSDKLKFSKKVKTPNFPYKSTLPHPVPPASYEFFDITGVNTFLKALKQTRLAQKNILENIKSDSLNLIETYQNDIDQARTIRSVAVQNLTTSAILSPLRITAIGAVSGYSAQLTGLLNDLIADVTLSITFDTQINVLLALLTNPQNILTSPTSTSADKNAATIEINTINSEINIIKVMKDKFNTAISNERNQIDATYSASVVNPKNEIVIETNNIKTATGNYNDAVEQFISNYRNAL